MTSQMAPSEVRCHVCGGELLLRRIDNLQVVEYRTHCYGCGWVSPLREHWCEGCQANKLFVWIGEKWRCTMCDHIHGDQLPPRGLETGGRGLLSERILEAIPYDEWISSREIADRIGVGTRIVAQMIRYRLLYVYVERKPMKPGVILAYVYRRLRHLCAPGHHDSGRLQC
jgi:hypothetical protein